MTHKPTFCNRKQEAAIPETTRTTHVQNLSHRYPVNEHAQDALTCDIHRCSHSEKQPHCSGVQVHIHNHAYKGIPKPRHPYSKDTCEIPTQGSVHLCGVDGKSVHECLKAPKDPYPHSGQCSLHLDFSHEPDRHPKPDYGLDHSKCHGPRYFPLDRADVVRVWGPPLPVWNARPCGSRVAQA